MGVFGRIRAPLKNVINLLMSEDMLREWVTYKKHTGQSFNDSLKYNVDTFLSKKMFAIRMKHTRNTVAVATAEVQVGDILFVFRNEDLPVVDELSVKDLIEDKDSVTYKVKSIDPVFEFVTLISVEGS